MRSREEPEVKLKLELKYKKAFLKLADVTGELDIKPIAEATTGPLIARKIIAGLADLGLKGTVTIDETEVVNI